MLLAYAVDEKRKLMIASSVSMRFGYYLPLEDKTLVLHDRCDIFCHYTVTQLVFILMHSKCSCKKKYEELFLHTFDCLLKQYKK